jgi:hypothetical protein
MMNSTSFLPLNFLRCGPSSLVLPSSRALVAIPAKLHAIGTRRDFN